MSRTTTGPIVAVLLALALPAAAGASAYEADPNGYARGSIVPAGLAPPAAFAPIGIVDDVVDASVPDVSQVKVLKKSPGKRLNPKPPQGVHVWHGTEVASVAAGRADGQGIIGVAPGAPLLSWGYETADCDEVADGVLALADAGAKVINLSMEIDDQTPGVDVATDCRRLKLAIAAVYGEGVLVVASAGNERRHGDPTEYPGAYPHVLTVGALDLGMQPAADSSTGQGLDLVAPGEAIPVALPKAFDLDGTPDGLTTDDGTSFSAPMVSGAASWLIAARPGLAVSQYADLLRATAKDAGTARWDRRTGFGTVNLAAALTEPVRAPADRGEPNDDVQQVDGSVFDEPDPYLTGRVGATASPYEDPADFYRVRIKARSSKTITFTSTSPYLSLSVYRGSKRVAKGSTLKIRNTASKSATYYAVVRASGPRVAAGLAYWLNVG